MIWRRRPPRRSSAAQEHLEHAHRELEEAKELRREATEVSRALDHSRAINHFGLGLELAMKGRA